MGLAALVEVYALRSAILIEGLRDRTKYVPQLWNWENHS